MDIQKKYERYYDRMVEEHEDKQKEELSAYERINAEVEEEDEQWEKTNKLKKYLNLENTSGYNIIKRCLWAIYRQTYKRKLWKKI